MTIGALPPRSGAINVAPAVAKIAPADATAGRGFADALRGVTLADSWDRNADAAPQDHASCFNQHGFFAHADGINAATLAVTAPPPPDGVVQCGASGIAATPPSAAPSQADLPDPAFPVSTAEASRRVGEATAKGAAEHATALRTGAIATPSPSPAPPPTAFLPIVPTDRSSIVSVRAGRTRPAQDLAAKIPITVTLDTADGAAAVTVSAHGLTDGEVDTLHTGIVALLRRHGRAIGDIRLNGRPMAQGRDRSGT